MPKFLIVASEVVLYSGEVEAETEQDAIDLFQVEKCAVDINGFQIESIRELKNGTA